MAGLTMDSSGDKRQYKRFKVRDEGVVGRLNNEQLVDIVDMSVGGIALEAGARLVVGRDYVLRLHDRRNVLDVRGTVVRSRAVGRRQNLSGQWWPVYAAAIRLREGLEDQVADFICDALLAPENQDRSANGVMRRQGIDG